MVFSLSCMLVQLDLCEGCLLRKLTSHNVHFYAVVYVISFFQCLLFPPHTSRKTEAITKKKCFHHLIIFKNKHLKNNEQIKAYDKHYIYFLLIVSPNTSFEQSQSVLILMYSVIL